MAQEKQPKRTTFSDMTPSEAFSRVQKIRLDAEEKKQEEQYQKACQERRERIVKHAMQRHPNLSYEKALEMVKAFD